MKKHNYLFLAISIALMTFGSGLFAQGIPGPKKLVFPTSQTNGRFGSPEHEHDHIVLNPEKAISSNLYDYSVLRVWEGEPGCGVEQILTFSSDIPEGKIVKVKLSYRARYSIVSVQKMNGNIPVGAEVTFSDLSSMEFHIENIFEVPLTVEPGEVVNGVRVRASSPTLGISIHAYLYGAYYEVEETNLVDLDCSQFNAYSATSGIYHHMDTTLPSGRNLINNHQLAFDGDLNTAVNMTMLAPDYPSSIYFDAHFFNNTMLGDQIRLTLSSQITSTSVPFVDILGVMKLVFYNDQGEIGSIPFSQDLMISNPLAPNDTYTFQFSAPAGYNKVRLECDMRQHQIQNIPYFGHLAIHEFTRLPASPTVEGAVNDTMYIYLGNTVDLMAIPPIASDDIIWFDEDDQQVGMGTSYTTPVINDNTIYKVLTSRYNCILDASFARNIFILTKVVVPNTLNPIIADVESEEVLAMEGVDAVGVDYSYTLVSGSLPAGLTLNPDGSITGISSELGTFPIEVEVYDETNGILVGMFFWELEVQDPNPLNIHLLSFGAQWNQEQNALLTWETVGSTMINSFNVQQSTDAKTWVTIGAVRYQDAAVYHYVDEKAKQSPANFYRLELVEDFGNSYSKVVQLISDNAVEQPVIFPNPVHQKINIQHQKELTQVSVYNIVGQLVYSVDRPSSEISLDHLSAGQYIIVVTDQNGQVFQQKIIKK